MYPKVKRKDIAAPIDASVSSLSDMSVEQLFDEAAKYGRIHIYSSVSAEHPCRYKCSIEFATVKHTKMEAESDREQTVKNALIQAIENAKMMVGLALQIGGKNDQ